MVLESLPPELNSRLQQWFLQAGIDATPVQEAMVAQLLAAAQGTPMGPIPIDGLDEETWEMCLAQVRQTGVAQTPEFKRWFGDSKVVDETGEPIVFYHGGDASFPGVGGKGRFGRSIFVREGKPSGYGDVQHAVFVKGPILELGQMKRLLVSEKGQESVRKILGDDVQDSVLDGVVDALTDGSHYPTSEKVWDAIGAIDEADAQREIQLLRGKVAQALGYDAVRTPDEFDGDTVMVLSPNQIKSATGKRDGEDRVVTHVGEGGQKIAAIPMVSRKDALNEFWESAIPQSDLRFDRQGHLVPAEDQPSAPQAPCHCPAP